MMKQIIINSLIIGLITSILGSVILRIVINGSNEIDSFDLIMRRYKKNYVVEVSLFFTGVLIYLLMEYFGLNKNQTTLHPIIINKSPVTDSNSQIKTPETPVSPKTKLE